MDPLIIPIVGMAIPIVVVPVALVSKYALASRQLEHAERMKALELGLALPRDESWWSPPRIAVALGAVVPLGVFLMALLANESHGEQPGIWISAMLVGTTGVGCGLALAMRHLTHSQQALNARDLYSKPIVDEDAFDVVGSRG